jgi:hypothetical protein
MRERPPAAPNLRRKRSTPTELCEVISVTSAIVPRCRSNGLATLLATGRSIKGREQFISDRRRDNRRGGDVAREWLRLTGYGCFSGGYPVMGRETIVRSEPAGLAPSASFVTVGNCGEPGGPVSGTDSDRADIKSRLRGSGPGRIGIRRHLPMPVTAAAAGGCNRACRRGRWRRVIHVLKILRDRGTGKCRCRRDEHAAR